MSALSAMSTKNHRTMKEKKHYIAPQIVAVTFHVEKGYSLSTLSLVDQEYTRDMEDYEVVDNWNSGSSNTFWD